MDSDEGSLNYSDFEDQYSPPDYYGYDSDPDLNDCYDYADDYDDCYAVHEDNIANDYPPIPSEEELRRMKRCIAICEKQNEDRKQGLFCDAKIVVENETFPVHKTVLKASSTYFSAMFTGSFVEKNEKCIEIQGISPKVFSEILEYLYCGELKLSFENMKDLYMAADMLCIDQFISDCESYMKENWRKSSDIVAVYEMANLFEMSSIAETIIDFARTTLQNFWEGDFKTLPYEFLILVLEGRTKSHAFEQTMAEDLLKWIFFKPQERLSEMALKLLSHVDFRYIVDVSGLLEFINSQVTFVNADEMKAFKDGFNDLHLKVKKETSSDGTSIV